LPGELPTAEWNSSKDATMMQGPIRRDRKPPRDPLDDPFKISHLAQIDNKVWHDFKAACSRNGHAPVEALQTLMKLYTEDVSFTLQPISNNSSE
jgi:hypothetical protein